MGGQLKKVDQEIEKYKTDHRGDNPLYILVSPHEADTIFEEIRKLNGADTNVVITTYKESKIMKHDALHKGELLLTNELPGD